MVGSSAISRAGPQRYGHGDGHTLALAAREFMRIPARAEAVGGQADAIKPVAGNGTGFAARQVFVKAHRLGHLVADGHKGG